MHASDCSSIIDRGELSPAITITITIIITIAPQLAEHSTACARICVAARNLIIRITRVLLPVQ